MREADTGYFRSMSIAGSFVVLAVMLVFAAILGPARPTRFGLAKRDARPRDLERGDPEGERRRDRGFDPGHELEGKRSRGIPHPDEYDIFGNPWKRASLESDAASNAAYLSLSGGRPRDLRSYDADPEPRRGLDLPDPDVFNMPPEDEGNPFADAFANHVPDPRPVRPGLIAFRTLTSLGTRLLRWKESALAGGKEEQGEARDLGPTPYSSTNAGGGSDNSGTPDLAALSAAAATVRAPADGPLPAWLITPKASAGPRAPRFFEVDVDGPTIEPPDHEFVAWQHEQLARVPIPARPGMPRGLTWHPGPEGSDEGSHHRPGVARNQTAAV